MANVMIQSPTYGDIYFDAVFKTSHEYQVTATEHPVQNGAPITDHSYMEPEKVTLSVGMSDVMSDNVGHSENMFTVLRSLIKEREPVTLVTRYCTYENMLMTGLTVPDETSVMYGLKAEMAFQHIEIVTAQVVKVNARIISSKTTSSSTTTQSTGEYDDLLDLGSGNSMLNAIGSFLGDIFSGSGSSITEPLYPTTVAVAGETVNKSEIVENDMGVSTYNNDPVYEDGSGNYFYIGP